MRLTQHTDYALRVLMYVALHEGNRVQSAAIAERYDISRHHLGKVVHGLSRRNYIRTVQGRNGGLMLAKPVTAISVGQVVRDFEPDLHLVDCFNPDNADTCCITSACVLRHALQDAQQSFLQRLDRVSLAELVQPKNTLRTLLRIAPQTTGTSR